MLGTVIRNEDNPCGKGAARTRSGSRKSGCAQVAESCRTVRHHGEPLVGALSATERWILPVCLNHRNGPATDQMLLLTIYPHCVQASTVFLTDTLAIEQR